MQTGELMDKVADFLVAASVVAALLVLGYSIGSQPVGTDQWQAWPECQGGYRLVVDFDLGASTGSAWCERIVDAAEECY